ncbi:MAG TPA: DUF3943 domain-containing protein, partial [Thermodesulfobacteriota bacterium]|nr:DUF3943 domain-containing protein [Thermodesulfobacteriota bacterium]
MRRYFLIFLTLLFAVQAMAQEQVEVKDLYNSAFSENAATDEKEEPVKEDGFISGEESAERLGVNAFLRDSAIMYTGLWAARFFYVRNKNSRIFSASFSGWWDNISQWPVWDDGDSFFTNWVTHPIIGSQEYLFYRAMGHSYLVSALGVVLQSTLFEYT